MEARPCGPPGVGTEGLVLGGMGALDRLEAEKRHGLCIIF